MCRFGRHIHKWMRHKLDEYPNGGYCASFVLKVPDHPFGLGVKREDGPIPSLPPQR
jgi:hypothetical protein